MSFEQGEKYRNRAIIAAGLLEEEQDPEVFQAFHNQAVRYSSLATMEYMRELLTQTAPTETTCELRHLDQFVTQNERNA